VGRPLDEAQLRALIPTVIGVLGRRGADFAAAEDAVQEALVDAVRVWPDDPPRDPEGWLVAVAWRRFLDAVRAGSSRRLREVRVDASRHHSRPGRWTTRFSSPSCAPTRR
jgi:predicted RNA polymerase sigma factor